MSLLRRWPRLPRSSQCVPLACERHRNGAAMWQTSRAWEPGSSVRTRSSRSRCSSHARRAILRGPQASRPRLPSQGRPMGRPRTSTHPCRAPLMTPVSSWSRQVTRTPARLGSCGGASDTSDKERRDSRRRLTRVLFCPTTGPSTVGPLRMPLQPRRGVHEPFSSRCESMGSSRRRARPTPRRLALIVRTPRSA